MSENNNTDSIQQKVDEDALLLNSYVKEKFPKTKLLLLHYLNGTYSNPYGFRRSAIITKNSGLSKLVEITDKLYNFIKHREALQRFIKQFNRENTFLHLLSNYCNITQGEEATKLFKDGFIGLLNVAPKIGNIRKKDFLIKKVKGQYKEFIYPDKQLVEWHLDSNFVSTLLPYSSEENKTGYITKLIEKLYADDWDKKEMEKWEQLFSFSLHSALSRYLENDENVLAKNPIRDFENRLLYRESIYEKLAAFQSGILYFIKALETEKDNHSSCSIVLKTYNPSNIEGNNNLDNYPIRTAVAIITPAIKDISELKKIGDNYLISYLKNLNAKCDPNYYLPTIQSLNKSIIKNRENKEIKLPNYLHANIQQVFNKYELYKNSYHLYSLWILEILEKLQDKIHEGDYLDFYFVCGDKSSFEDHENSNLRFIDDKHTKLMDIPTKDIEEDNKPELFIRKIDKIVELLSGEHFPWFEEGRCALFYDITSVNSLAPIGVLSTQKSWGQIVEDVINGEDDIDLPNCILYSVNSNLKLISVFIIKNNGIKEIIRWKDKKWIRWNKEERKDDLKAALEITLNAKKGSTIDDISKIAIRISENPKKGGSIVFVDDCNNSNLTFETEASSELAFCGTMGYPLELKDAVYSDEDKIALISHDGATLFYLNEINGWYFRNLLTSNSISSKIIGELFKLVNKNFYSSLGYKLENGDIKEDSITETCPLLYKGSRRWSAAITSLHEKVKAVLVISQDGEMFIWTALDKTDLNYIYVIKLELGASPIVLNLGTGIKMSLKDFKILNNN